MVLVEFKLNNNIYPALINLSFYSSLRIKKKFLIVKYSVLNI